MWNLMTDHQIKNLPLEPFLNKKLKGKNNFFPKGRKAKTVHTGYKQQKYTKNPPFQKENAQVKSSFFGVSVPEFPEMRENTDKSMKPVTKTGLC
jgi:hypothetical protein